MHSSPSATAPAQSVPERLNQECFCITLDRHALIKALEREVGDEELCANFIKARPHLFSNIPVFISEREMGEMLRVVQAVEAAAQLPGYRDAVLSWAPEIARAEFGPRGAFMGYDFHLARAPGRKMIEVNSMLPAAPSSTCRRADRPSRAARLLRRGRRLRQIGRRRSR